MSGTASLATRTIDAIPDDLHGQLLKDFEAADSTSRDARWASERDQDYYDGKQWTYEQAKVLRDRNQPLIWDNIIRDKVDLLCGLERRGRSDPKAFPRTPDEQNRADIATQMLRFLADENRFDVIRSSVHADILIKGLGGAEVIVEQASAQDSMMGSTALTPLRPTYNVVVNHVPWERIYHDPHSQHPGFSDANYLGTGIWMDRTDAVERYPGREDVLSATFSTPRADTFSDKPQTAWVDSLRRRVFVVQHHWKQRGEWWVATFTRGGFLEDPQKSPYLDRHGRAACPLILRSCYCDRDNNRYGVVRDMVPLQDAVNQLRSKLQHALNVNQLIMEDGAVEDEDEARRQAARPDGLIKRNRGYEFEIRKDTAEITGHFQMLQYTIGRVNATGPNAALSGKDPRDQSGRAIIAQQAGGQVQNEPIADTLRQWTHKIYEALWMRARQFLTDQMWIRVTDDTRSVRFVGINRRVTLLDELQSMAPDQAQQIAAKLMLRPGDPRLSQVIRTENDINDMDVDITVEEGPDVPTMQAETWQAFQQLPPQILMQFPPQFFIEANPSIRDKDKYVKMLEEHQQQIAAAQQQQHAAQQAMQQAQVKKVNADAADTQAQTVERLHRVAVDHAEIQHQPVVPGIGTVSPDINPILQPPPAQPQAPQPF